MTLKLSIKLFAAAVFFATAAQAQTTFMEVVGVRDGDTLNVRTGPGTKFEDIGDYQPSEMVPILGYDSSGKWAKVRYRGQVGYVAVKFLRDPFRADGSSISTGAHVVTGIKVGDPDGGLVVRDGAGKSFANIGVLRNNTAVHVIQRSPNGKWAMINHGAGIGWVSTAYLNSANQQGGANPQPMPSPTPQTAPDGGSLPGVFTVTGVSANDVLNIRDAPRVSGSRIGGFAPGQRVSVLGMASSTWAKVSFGQSVGFVNIGFLARNTGGGATTVNGFQMGIICQGTEPFWTLDIAEDRTVTFNSLINGQAPLASLQQTTPSSLTGSYPFTFSAPPYSGVVKAEYCTDGMSDIQYPWSIILNKPSQNGGTETVYGCCRLR